MDVTDLEYTLTAHSLGVCIVRYACLWNGLYHVRPNKTIDHMSRS